MQKALEQAQLAFAKDEIPIGAVIVERLSGKIISAAHNLTEAKNNPILHAEIVAINNACQIIGSKNLKNYDIYVTVEPCAMCGCAIAHSRLKRLYYGALDPKHGSVESNIYFFNSKACFYRPEIYSGILAENSELLMKNFFKKIRLCSNS